MLRRQRAGEEGRMPVPEVGGELEVFFHQTVTKRPFKGGCPAREVAGEYRETIVVGGFAMRKTSTFIVSFLALGLLALSSAVPAPAAAQDCPRSFLDDRYCDRDGNLTADLPLDPAEWVEPDTLIFSYTPVEDPSVYKSVWDGFIAHLSEVTGKEDSFLPVQSHAAPSQGM